MTQTKKTAFANLLVYLLSTLILPFRVQAYTNNLYFKAEVPLIESDIEKRTSARDLRFSKSLTAPRFPSLGAGYRLSEFIAIELMYGVQKHNLMAYGLNATTNSLISVNDEYAKDKFGRWFPPKTNRNGYKVDAYCATSTLFTPQDDICGITTSTVTNTADAYVRSNIHFIVASLRLMPFKQISFFIPYVSMGAGIAHSQSKYTESFYIDNILTNVSKGTKSTTGPALEFGIGTQINISKKFNLDLTAKYFDYGKHALAPNISRKINGYRVTAGAMVVFPIKNGSATANKDHDNFVHANSKNSTVQITHNHIPAHNETTENFIRKQGVAEGERNATTTIAKRMLKLGMDEANVAAVTGLSIDDLDRIIDELK